MVTIVGRYNLYKSCSIISYSQKDIVSAILFKKSIFYKPEYDIPKVKILYEYNLNDEQLYKIKTFLDKYGRSNEFRFFKSILFNDSVKEVQKKWENKIWK